MKKLNAFLLIDKGDLTPGETDLDTITKQKYLQGGRAYRKFAIFIIATWYIFTPFMFIFSVSMLVFFVKNDPSSLSGEDIVYLIGIPITAYIGLRSAVLIPGALKWALRNYTVKTVSG